MRVLLVTPEFRGYWQSYKSALEELGHNVKVHQYDNFHTAGIFAVDKLVDRLPERLASPARTLTLTRRVTHKALAYLDSVQVDVALIIKGDLLEHQFWDALERRRIPSVLYLYDELARMQHTAETLRRPGHVATYSPRDCRRLKEEGYPATFVPLSFDPKLAFNPVHQDAVVFVGARYPQRESLLVDLHERGVPVVAYGREWSHRPVDRLLSLKPRRLQIAGHPDVTLPESYGLAAGAAAAINIHVGGPGAEFDGINSRTFEICGVGGLQLSDRSDVDSFYDIGTEILVYRSPAELEDLAQRAVKDRGWSNKIREAGRRRTLAEHTCLHRVQDLVELW